MTLLPVVDPFLLDDDTGDEYHVWCCRRSRALCGAHIDPDDTLDEDDGRDDAAELCETCRWKEAVRATCGARLCRIRRRVRRS